SLQFANFDGLRLCSQLRSLERTRNVPLLGLIDSDSDSRVLRGLEIGVSDYLVLPFDAYEVRARVQTQIRKKRYGMLLRESAPSPTETIVTDGLTKLYNRRYMESHLATLVEHAVSRGKPLSILMLDIDYFGSINDSYGDDAGDDTLREFAERLRKSTRGIDLLCRYGGEEFVAVLPETDMAMATVLAERIRRSIGAEAFTVPHGGKPIELTTSIGLACFMTDDTAESLLERARQAVDRAKRDGCNRVVADAA
ncbi:MAG TPA: diguanylate cyclase, partial [Xanthobacteraceae bacterium]|nr:diguanylate cyclase [Xanthobacteraceae bacterium]